MLVTAARRLAFTVVAAGRGKSSGSGRAMPTGVKKENLPSKVCVKCNRPFTWRKKWERCWEEVRFCSKRCRSEFKAANPGAAAGPEDVDDDER